MDRSSAHCTSELTRLQRILEKTTKAHFKRALRGLTARNWEGVAGPGHTWAIDSTVGDIYLRSSVNRAWIVGRPIVYIIVDIWSTAVVGFYVCLTGPSWNTAKVSLFNATADPALLGDLWGYEPIHVSRTRAHDVLLAACAIVGSTSRKATARRRSSSFRLPATRRRTAPI